MEWIKKFNKAINYIEENLIEELYYDNISEVADCSTYHFQRMFAYIANVPLSEYIRRRRMSLAVVDLQTSNEKIIDIALKYGYSSPTAFNRAFHAIHGVAPSAVRSYSLSVKSFPPLKFNLIVKGGTEMNYRIETKEAFKILGVSNPLSKDINENFSIVPQMWGDAVAMGILEKLVPLMNSQPKGLLGVSVCNDTEEWKYFIAVATTSSTNDFEEYTIPAMTWAIFPGSGSTASIQELETSIITEWLPTSGYEYADAPDIEVYLNADPENAEYEIWLPVVKKQN